MPQAEKEKSGLEPETEQLTEFLIWDDRGIIGHPSIRDGLSWDAFVEGCSSLVLNLWHPITVLSHQVDLTLFGRNADLHHLSSIGYHLVACIALYFCLREIKTAQGRILSDKAAAIVAILAGLHPMHVEAWAWISQRKEILAAIFCYLSLGCWARWNLRRAWPPLVLAFVAFALALMSKPSAIVLPILLLLTTFLQCGRVDRRTLCVIAPFLLLSAGCAFITLSANAGRDVEVLAAFSTRSLDERAIVGTLNLKLYAAKIFWPDPICYVYPPRRTFASLELLTTVLGAVALAGAAWSFRRKFPLFLWAIAWFCIVLAPTCGFIMSGDSNAPDRYSYLAYTGPFVLGAVGLQRLAGILGKRGRYSLFAVGIIIGTVFALCSFKLAWRWRSIETLARPAIAEFAENARAHAHLARDLQMRGGRTDLEHARSHLETALTIVPKSRDWWAMLAAIHYGLGDNLRAEISFRKQLEISPLHRGSLSGLSRLLSEAGDLAGALGAMELLSEHHFPSDLDLQADIARLREMIGAGGGNSE